MYISIDDNFLIKNHISFELLDKCFAFIESQSGIKKNLIEKAFKKKILHSIEFPKKINSEIIDMVIKTKLSTLLQCIIFFTLIEKTLNNKIVRFFYKIF